VLQIVVDCEVPSRLARFWAALMPGYGVRAYDDAEIARLARLGLTPDSDPTVMVDGPGPTFYFQRVEGRVRAQPGRDRIHVDVPVTDLSAAVAHAHGLGARTLREASDYVVLCDPEGNRFCLALPHGHASGHTRAPHGP